MHASSLEQTFEAVVLDWDGITGADGHADRSRLRSSIEALCSSGTHVIVMSEVTVAELDRGLGARPGGPGRILFCGHRSAEVYEASSHGVALVSTESGGTHTDAGDNVTSSRWIARWLSNRGIAGQLVLIVTNGVGSDEVGDSLAPAPEWSRAIVAPVGSDPTRVVELLDDQVTRRRQRRVPWIDHDPDWVVSLSGDRTAARVTEALGALANGYAGTRASLEEDGPGTAPLFVVNGVYTRDSVPRLLEGPVWTSLQIHGAGRGTRLLDLRTGLLVREDAASGLRSARFVSANRPHILALRAEAPTERLEVTDTFFTAPHAVERRARADTHMARAGDPEGRGIVVAARDRWQVVADRRVVERLAAWSAEPGSIPGWEEASARLAGADDAGFEQLLAEHRATWARRWAEAEVTIEGDADAQLAARFAVFHLLSAAPETGEAAVGPRGLTGPGYGGHVFWDADVFILPALAAIRPEAARAMLEYRIRRLPVARAATAERGLLGARFPWESADSGSDVTPRSVTGRQGGIVPIRTGDAEEHIVADVAWSAHAYTAWTGDRDLLAGPARGLLVETARYWAGRIRRDPHGRGHLDGVMGPDEYHEVVDDNAYTNVMARWNLRRAADLVEECGGDLAEATEWRQIAETLVDGWDPTRRLHEQFAGYWDLEPLFAAKIAPPPFAADILLGAGRVSGSQLIKQADVVMLHHLVPDEVVPGSREGDLAFYESRTAHGSSLSPAIYAAQFARAGQPARALELFRVAARLDLDDLTGTTAVGLHLATMGGLWQALAYGFLGLRPHDDALDIDPCLPTAWHALGLRFRYHGQVVRVRADHDSVGVSCDEPVSVRVAGGATQTCCPPSARFSLPHRPGSPSERTLQ